MPELRPPYRVLSAAPRHRALTALVLVFSILLGLLILPPSISPILTETEAATTELFFSEYIEGSGFNKALEIYNGTGGPVSLTGYTVEIYFNGGTTNPLVLTPTGSIANGDVYVIANTSAGTPADPAILAQADLVSAAGFYNGDDAIVLKKNGTVIDSIGQVGFDPGTEWGTLLVSTADNTIRRKSIVCAGDTNSTNAFDPSAEWDGFANNTFDGLGAHSATCGGGPTPTSPSGSGAAAPSTLSVGETSLLTVTVTPGANPASTALAVTGDLTAIGAAAAQPFFDNGTNGDAVPNDNTFSYSATVAAGTANGPKSLPATILDAQGRTGGTSISLTIVAPPPPGVLLPFVQNWSDTGLITANNNWSGIAGIVGYRGDNLSALPGTDPQTVLADGSNTPVNVTANMTDTSSTSGGIGEFHLENPVVAFQGSGTADAPHLVIGVNTTGVSNVAVFYTLRDIDGTADNSVQPVALQYRVGNTGNFTNIPAAFVPDASAGPGEAGRETPVAVLLPAAANNKSLVQIRIITNDAVGSDEWIGIDDIQVVPNGTIPLSGSGSASPNRVNAGANALLTVKVNSATNPASTGISVTGDLSSIGGSNTQPFFDNGTNGDAVAGDNTFSYSVAVASNASTGSIPVQIADAQGRTASTSISLIVNAPRDPALHLTMGNPTDASTDANALTNYLLAKPEYAVGYNCDRGIPNWVSWHLDASWIGGVGRQDDFRPDPTLPVGCYAVTQFDYVFAENGFSRGHHTPSGDRTATIPENSATFLMTNMMPQGPDNNEGPWEKLEGYSRSLVNQGNELYIIAGGYGKGGTGDQGYRETLADGKVTVPAITWKVVIVLPNGSDDVNRVTEQTRAFGVIMPNSNGILADSWQKYAATVDQVEALTGYDFFENVPDHIEEIIESRVDAFSNSAPIAHPQSVTTAEDTAKGITLTATDANVNNVLTYSIVTGPAHGTLSGSGANLTYTPDANYNGADSFEFEVTDGGASSRATVSVQVTAVNDAPTLDLIPSQTVYLGDTLNFAATASDVDAPETLRFSLTGTVPAGASIDPNTAAFTWTPTASQAGKVHTFGVRVTDSGGLYMDQTVSIAVAYPWSGVTGKLSAGADSYRLGSTIPVTFRLTGAAAGITDATAWLYLAKVENGTPGAEFAATPSGNANSGNLFRYDPTAGQYIYNLSTKGLTAGVYQLRVDLGDGVERTVFVTLN